jgi:hypothetical protein
MFKSPWKYDTAEEDSVSVGPVTGGRGILYLINPSENTGCNVNYQYGSLGTAKGAVVNYAKSWKSTASGGLTHVYSRPFHDFDTDDFPCGGYLLVVGETAGIFAPSFFDNSGMSVVIAIFGFIPFAALAFWGNFDSALPSAGVSAALCKFGDPWVFST